MNKEDDSAATSDKDDQYTPKIDEEAVCSPPPWLPWADGFMPLTAAAYWIASKGGTTEVRFADPSWEIAFEQLSRKIDEGTIAALGRCELSANEGYEQIPAIQFHNLKVFVPSSDIDFAVLLGCRDYLQANLIFDRAGWGKNDSDRIYSNGRLIWTEIEVRCADLRKQFPQLMTERPVAPHKPFVPEGYEPIERGVLRVSKGEQELGSDNPPRRKKAKTQIPEVIAALREEYGAERPVTNRQDMLRRVIKRMNRPVSLRTLDRAREELWK
jgi:hypothetical protein